GTPPPRQRLAAMRRLRDAGIRAGVLMAPLLPGLSARPEQVEATVRAAADHGAAFVSAVVLHLGPGVREHFLSFLAREYPTLCVDYWKLYAGKYTSRRYQDDVYGQVGRLKQALLLGDRYPTPRQPPA